MYNNFVPKNNFTNPYLNYMPQQPYSQPFQQPQIMPQNSMIPNNMPVNNGNYTVIPVASIDEAKAVQTSFDGSILILPDFNNRKIYTKRLNMNTGASIFTEYTVNEPTQNNIIADIDDNIDTNKKNKSNNVKYVREEDFLALKQQYEQLKKDVEEKLNSITNSAVPASSVPANKTETVIENKNLNKK